MSLDPSSDRPSSDRPLYRQIADQLRDAIARGEYPPGSQLPSEVALMERLGHARGTVRQALGVLRTEGLLVTEPGRGVFVRERPPIRRTPDRYIRSARQPDHGPYHAEVTRQGQTPRQRLLQVGPVPAPADVADRLGIEEGEQVLVRRHVLMMGDEPVQIGNSYFPYDLAKDSRIAKDVRIPGGAHAELEDALGHALEYFVEDIMCRMPTGEEAELLGLGSGEPVFRLIYTAYDEQDVPVEVFDAVLVGARHILSYRIPAHP